MIGKQQTGPIIRHCPEEVENVEKNPGQKPCHAGQHEQREEYLREPNTYLRKGGLVGA